MDMIICGQECEDCIHYVDELEDRRKIYCSYKEKTYWYGQCIPCDNKVKRRPDEYKQRG